MDLATVHDNINRFFYTSNRRFEAPPQMATFYNINNSYNSIYNLRYSLPVTAPHRPEPLLIYGVGNSFNTTYNYYTVPFAQHPALKWLSPLDPRARHRAMGINRVAGVGDWLLLTNQFTQWSRDIKETAMPILFCYGDPGVGKSYLRYWCCYP